MRIAYLANPTTGNGFYRGIAPMMALELRGHEVTRLPAGDGPLPLDRVRGIDVLHVHRFCDDRAQRLVREAKRHGAAVVWDNDDDMSAVPRGTVTYRRVGGINWERRLAEMKRIFRDVDLVTTPSRALAARLASAGATRTAVIENHPPDQFLRVQQRPHDGVVIGWIAGLEHQMDVERVPIREALQHLLDERPEVHVRTFGLKLGLQGERSTNVDVVPLLELTQRATEFDVGIAPIADLAVNHARSNIKVKEYAAAGLPWLASPIGPYAELGEREGGRLVADDRWYDELLRLIDKPRDRRKLAKRATKWAEGETIERNAHVWEQHLLDAVGRAGGASR